MSETWHGTAGCNIQDNTSGSALLFLVIVIVSLTDVYFPASATVVLTVPVRSFSVQDSSSGLLCETGRSCPPRTLG